MKYEIKVVFHTLHGEAYPEPNEGTYECDTVIEGAAYFAKHLLVWLNNDSKTPVVSWQDLRTIELAFHDVNNSLQDYKEFLIPMESDRGVAYCAIKRLHGNVAHGRVAQAPDNPNMPVFHVDASAEGAVPVNSDPIADPFALPKKGRGRPKAAPKPVEAPKSKGHAISSAGVMGT